MSTCVPKGSRSAKVEPRDVDLQPEVKWHDGAAGYVARLDLAGFRKEEFRVQVDGAGRVTDLRHQEWLSLIYMHIVGICDELGDCWN
ncbi:hypothetical protein OsI_02621 [Oryza sativa Indica Group]|uniref:Uncharacterized protein n=1 Tax=Oryza sativa subsp. indica TaxID=39946 RepID=B8AB70_ORYSI|nr:hypothetical protein OsI_02621 [Oryza sativa Indica Group]